MPMQRLHGKGSARKLQLWYPAQSGSTAQPVSYAPDPGTIGILRNTKFLDQPECVFESWARLKLQAKEQARPVRTPQKFPLVLISPGSGLPRFFYSGYAQQLASDGYIVATIDYANCGFLADNGKLLDECSNEVTEAAFALVAADWAAHISEVLDELLGKRASAGPLVSEISSHIDAGRITSMGHSLGGESSMIACAQDARIRACINADGGMGGTKLVETGIHSTALFVRSHPLYSDADLARRHRTREEFDRMGAKFMAETRALFANPGGDAWVLSVSGTGHMSFSDAPYTMPNTISRFGGTIIAPERLSTIVIRLLENYMQHEFDRKAAFRTDEFPEITLQASRAAQ